MFKNLMNTKKKVLIIILIVMFFILTIGYFILSKNNDYLILTKSTIKAEYGEVVSTDIGDWLDYSKVSKKEAESIVKNTKVKSNLKNEIVVTKDENGNVTSKEEKAYPKVGNYEITFSYKDEKETVKVVVEDTTKPKIDAPDTVDVVQYTDLSKFNFSELFKVTDYSNVKDWKIDTSKVDMNTVGQYDLGVFIEDIHGNKSSKKIKLNVVEAPQLADGEVAVTEIVKDESGKTKTVVTKKASSSVSSNDNVAGNKPVDNKDKVSSESNGSSVKPSKPSGNTGGNIGNNSSSNKPVHSHSWVAQTKTVHHDAQTKVVHHDAQTKVVHHPAETKTVTITDKAAWDEEVKESFLICNRCGYYTKDYEEMSSHMDTCGGRYHVGKIVVNTIHHPAETHQETKVVREAWDETVVVKAAWDETVVVKPAWDETVTTGYKCSSCGATK